MSTIHIGSEIIESQRVRSDLLKWKIITIAVIASVGLGISSKYLKFELALCIIPFVMVYIDALCLHINLRIFSIAKWHKTEKAKELINNSEFVYMQEYELFINKAYEVGAFKLEQWTIFYSSLVINFVLIAVPCLDLKGNIFKFKYPILISGFIGLLITIALNVYAHSTKSSVDKIEYPIKTISSDAKKSRG